MPRSPKLSLRDIEDIRRRYKAGATQRELAELYEVASTSINRVISGARLATKRKVRTKR